MRILPFFFIATFAFSNSLSQISKTQAKQEEDRLKFIESQKENSNIILETKTSEISNIILNEEPCFIINEILLTGKDSHKFKQYLKEASKNVNFKKGSCLGKNSINTIYNAFYNEILKAGLITTAINLPSQNLKSKTLKFEIIPGKIDTININDKNSTKNRASIFTSFGINKKGDILNLRDIEQALEVLQNASNGNVSFKLIPSNKENYSDIKITKEEKLPLNLSLSFDNLGSRATGKYQGGVNLNALNLMGFNEIWYSSYSKNIFKADKQSVENDTKRGKTDNIYYGITIPYKRFSLDFNEYRYNYDQAIPGAFGVYKYSGKSKRRNLTLNYLYHRDQISKNSIFFRLWEKENKNYIEDYELDNQRKKTAGYEVGLKSLFFIENGHIVFETTYKKGTGARGALKAPEEDYNDGTNRFETVTIDFNFNKSSSNVPLTYDFKFHGMWNNRPLTMQERLNIGGYYTVRGFDGEMSLVGNRGYYIRNTLEYEFLNSHKIYTAFDFGKVSGKDSKYLTENTLVGSGVGLKGYFKRKLQYDIFLGFSLNKPEFFKTDKNVLNFNLTYNF
jgi:putative hemolysin activation protein hecB